MSFHQPSADPEAIGLFLSTRLGLLDDISMKKLTRVPNPFLIFRNVQTPTLSPFIDPVSGGNLNTIANHMWFHLPTGAKGCWYGVFMASSELYQQLNGGKMGLVENWRCIATNGITLIVERARNGEFDRCTRVIVRKRKEKEESEESEENENDDEVSSLL
jgi:hypothetical protein